MRRCPTPCSGARWLNDRFATKAARFDPLLTLTSAQLRIAAGTWFEVLFREVIAQCAAILAGRDRGGRRAVGRTEISRW